MKKKLTPEQLEKIRKKHDHRESGYYDCTDGVVIKKDTSQTGTGDHHRPL
jgi:hypothetical protein